MTLTKLSDEQIKEKLKKLQVWELSGKLRKEFHLKDFNQVFDFYDKDCDLCLKKEKKQ